MTDPKDDPGFQGEGKKVGFSDRNGIDRSAEISYIIIKEMKHSGNSCKKWFFCLLAIFASPLLVGQSPFTPPSKSWKIMDEGFEVRSMQFQGLPFQSPFKIRALRVELDRFAVRVIDTRDFGVSRMDVKTMAQKAQAVAAINGGFFFPDYKPLGLLIVDGRETNPLRKADWGVFLVQNNVPKIVHTKEFLPDKNISQAIQVGPRLVVGGRELTLKKQIARRSAVGITYKNQVILANTEETEAYAQDLARIFWLPEDDGGLGCRDALTLDGGPSAQMYVEYKSLKIDIPGKWSVPSGLGVFKR
jgi:exopolysaccharide biosynthesis protein